MRGHLRVERPARGPVRALEDGVSPLSVIVADGGSPPRGRDELEFKMLESGDLDREHRCGRRAKRRRYVTEVGELAPGWPGTGTNGSPSLEGVVNLGPTELFSSLSNWGRHWSPSSAKAFMNCSNPTWYLGDLPVIG